MIKIERTNLKNELANLGIAYSRSVEKMIKDIEKSGSYKVTKNLHGITCNVEYVANSYGIQLYIDGEASGNILPFNESEIFYGTVGILHDFPRARRY